MRKLIFYSKVARPFRYYTRRTSLAFACFILALGGPFRALAQEPSGKYPADNYDEKVNGAELWIRYRPQQNQTVYGLSHAQIKPERVKGLRVSDHYFEVGLLGSSEGKFAQPDTITVDLTNRVAKRSMWLFPVGMSLSIKADGKRIFDAKCTSEPDFKKEKPGGCLRSDVEQNPLTEEFDGLLIFSMSFSDFQLMNSAKDISITIGNVSFNLDKITIDTFRTFAKRASGNLEQ